jgi:SAM-dependent methyltransferase
MLQARPKPRRKRILELASGENSPVLRRLIEKTSSGKHPVWYYGLDISHQGKSSKRQLNSLKIRFNKGAVSSFPYRLPNGKKIPPASIGELHMHMPFDTHLSERNFRNFLDEVDRILAPGGKAYFTTDARGIASYMARDGEPLPADEQISKNLAAIQSDSRFKVRKYWNWFDKRRMRKITSFSPMSGLAKALTDYPGHIVLFVLFEKRKL